MTETPHQVIYCRNKQRELKMNALIPSHYNGEKPFHNLRRAIHNVDSQKICLKSVIVTLHSSLTTWIFLTVGILVLAKQGTEPKQVCKLNNMYQENADFWNRYCRGVVYDEGFKPEYQYLLISPGIQPSPNESPRKLSFYYYFGETLVMIAIILHLPQIFLKLIENNQGTRMMNNLVEDLQNQVAQEKQIKVLSARVRRSIPTITLYRVYTLSAEILCWITLGISIQIINKHMSGLFLPYGFDLMKYEVSNEQNELINPITFAFPNIATCKQRIPQSDHKIKEFDVLCYLGGNKLYGRITILIWIWFVILSIANVINLINRLTVACSTRFRIRKFNRRFLDPWNGERNTIRKQIPKLSLTEFDVFLELSKNLSARQVLLILMEYVHSHTSPQEEEKFIETSI